MDPGVCCQTDLRAQGSCLRRLSGRSPPVLLSGGVCGRCVQVSAVGARAAWLSPSVLFASLRGVPLARWACSRAWRGTRSTAAATRKTFPGNALAGCCPASCGGSHLRLCLLWGAVFITWRCVTLGASQEKGLKWTLFQTSTSNRLITETLLEFRYFVDELLEFAKHLYLFVPSSRMLEDDLKLSSDEEEGEQVSSPWALCCLAWRHDADLAVRPGH